MIQKRRRRRKRWKHFSNFIYYHTIQNAKRYQKCRNNKPQLFFHWELHSSCNTTCVRCSMEKLWKEWQDSCCVICKTVHHKVKGSNVFPKITTRVLPWKSFLNLSTLSYYYVIPCCTETEGNINEKDRKKKKKKGLPISKTLATAIWLP